MKVIIEPRHTDNTEFRACADCAIAKAIREQYPSIRWVSVGVYEIYINNHSLPFQFAPMFKQMNFLALQNRKIDKFVVNIDYPAYDQQQKQLTDEVIERSTSEQYVPAVGVE